MATNKNLERFATFQVKIPASTTIASGAPLLFGKGSHTIACVAAEPQTNVPPIPNYDSGTGYITVDAEGVYNLTVKAFTQSSPSAGAAINPGDAVYADGGTYDVTTGLTTGITLDVDTGGTFFGTSLDSLAAGTTGVIRVILKNSSCA